MEATTGPLITHQRAVFSFVSQHLEGEQCVSVFKQQNHNVNLSDTKIGKQSLSISLYWSVEIKTWNDKRLK